MTQESRTQETSTPAQNSGELPEAALARVVGGGSDVGEKPPSTQPK